jgi:ferric-dicitrate binding protein FerR (iron transport regulator)
MSRMAKKKQVFDENRIRKFFNDENSSDEYLYELFRNDSNKEELKKYLFNHFNEISGSESYENERLNQILYKLNFKINHKRNSSLKLSRIFTWTSRVAAILFIPLLLFTGYNLIHSRKNAGTWVELNAPAWTRIQFSLPDGTTGWLNSNSSIRYNSDFLDDRSVKINGEAFFDVAKNPHNPFTVSTDEISLKVVGTKFNVFSYEEENNVEIVLEEGSLLFNDLETDGVYEMKPNDLVTYDKARKGMTAKPVQPQKYLSWKEGKLVFRNDPLDVICRRIGRWYNVDFEININNNPEIGLFATFTDENLEEVLEILKKSLPIEYEIRNGTLETDTNFYKKKVIITAK